MNHILIFKTDDGAFIIQSPSNPPGDKFEQAMNVIGRVRGDLNLLKPKTTEEMIAILQTKV